MITSQQAADIRARNDALTAWVDSVRGKNGSASYRPEDKPAYVPDVTNEERSALEVFEFVTGILQTYRVPAFGGFPSTRVPVTIRAINGKTYHGTYFKSSGNYARVKVSKGAR